MARGLATAFFLGVCIAVPVLRADEWAAARSTYTHDPRTGQRVYRYSPIGPVYAFPDRNVVQSGYRHIQSVIEAGGTADYLHVVEEWGRNPVRPYGEWQYPFRPYSVPYGLWGPPVMYGMPYGCPAPYGSYPTMPFPGPSGPGTWSGPWGAGGAGPWHGHHHGGGYAPPSGP
ncbi:MAG: hypothetical protein FJ297_01795 [Planctomycetes bacterium]|nr:hypothetical protein [Planctomycetota bacterium]